MPETTLIDGSPVTPDHRTIDPATGQQKSYVVLSEAERAKGFIRPVRQTYVHVGVRPTHPTRDLTDDERAQYPNFGYVAYEAYEPDGLVLGRYWTQEQLNSGCGKETWMGLALAETYARDPKFYGGTFCARCHRHLPLDEFVWLGTDDRLGT